MAVADGLGIPTDAGDTRIIVNSSALMSEVSDEKRFAKKIAANSNQLRNAAGDGLFTVWISDWNGSWSTR